MGTDTVHTGPTGTLPTEKFIGRRDPTGPKLGEAPPDIPWKNLVEYARIYKAAAKSSVD